MASNKKEKLFELFPEVSTEKWEEVITADLKGADYQKRLVWKTAEGFNVNPYYRAENLKEIAFLGGTAGEFPFVRGTKPNNVWKIHQTINVGSSPQEVNADALKAIKGGADSVGFSGIKDVDATFVAELLDKIDPTQTELVFEYSCGLRAAIEPIMEWAKKFNPTNVRINFVIDPIIERLSIAGDFGGCCDNGNKCFKIISEIINKYAEFKHVRFVGVGGDKFNASGSTIVQELTFALAAGHEYLAGLIEEGVAPKKAAKSIRFSLSVSSNYFMEIAKFRAARLLWANIVDAYTSECGCAEKMFVHATTSTWNMTAYDAYVNMLRGTTEAMSAALAGVYSLEVVPFDHAYQQPTDFSSHIARNVQLLLKNESHFDNVVDPAGGSYYIETLTKSISEEAWKLFKEIEELGGYIKAFKSGFVTDKIEAAAAVKDKEIATRRTTLLGTNQYPNFGEVADKVIVEESVKPYSCDCVKKELPHLKPYRGGMAFEQLRLAVDRNKTTIKAFMLTCGSLSMARARAQFSCNFFACAGIKVQDNTYFSSVEEGAKEALESGAQIVVVCSADDDYATLAPEVHKLIGDRAIVVVAGAPACQAELEAQGITHFINARQNVLETLKGYLKELQIF